MDESLEKYLYFKNPDNGLGATYLEIVYKRTGKVQQLVLNKEIIDKRFTSKGEKGEELRN